MELRTDAALPDESGPTSPGTPSRPPFLRLYALALAARLAVAMLFPNGDPGPGETFARYAVNLATGAGFGPSAFLPPGYPHLLGWIFRLHGSAWATIVLSQTIIGALTTLPVLLLARACGLRRGPTYVSALLVALLPSALAETGRISAVPLAALLFTTGAWLTVRRLPSPAPGSAILAGLCLGAAALTRGGLFFPALILPLALPAAQALSQRSALSPEPRAETWLRRGLIPAVMVLALAPWCVRNGRLHQRPTLVETTWGLRLYAATIPGSEPYTPPPPPRAEAHPDNLVLSNNDLAALQTLGYAADQPGQLAIRWLGRFGDYLIATSERGYDPARGIERRLLYRFAQAAVWGGLLTLVCAWLILRGMPGERERALFVTALAMVLLGVVTGAIADTRLLTAPLLALPAAAGMRDRASPPPTPRRARLFRTAVLFLWPVLVVGALRG